jgi:hypothetical protein
VATAALCRGDAIWELERDFDLVNGILTVALADQPSASSTAEPVLPAGSHRAAP